MSEDSASVYIDGAGVEWREAPEEGVTWKLLFDDPETGRRALLIKMEPGAIYRGHRHPDGEQYFIVEGSVEDGGRTLEAGSYVYHPPGSSHRPTTKTGCLVFVALPRRVAPLSEAECLGLRGHD